MRKIVPAHQLFGGETGNGNLSLAAASPQPFFDFMVRVLLRPSLLRWFEISQIRRWLVFADWHQHPVTVLIDPSTDRVARISRSGVKVRGPVAPVGVD